MDCLPEQYKTANFEQFDGFADIYDKYRPKMPSVVIDILTQLAQKSLPHLVVDIGCGTGLSTRVWGNRAEHVIGIEPSHDMRLKAEDQSQKLSNISYRNGTATDTQLQNGSADIVTICQALHWVEPNSTFKEVHRILRPGGIFAAIDYDLPSTTTLQIDKIEKEFLERTKKLMKICSLDSRIKQWDKQEHLHRMQMSRKFTYTKEIAVFSKKLGNIEQIVGFNLSHGNTQTLLKYGLSEEEIGLSTLRNQLQYILGKKSIPRYFTYRIRIGQK